MADFKGSYIIFSVFEVEHQAPILVLVFVISVLIQVEKLSLDLLRDIRGFFHRDIQIRLLQPRKQRGFMLFFFVKIKKKSKSFECFVNYIICPTLGNFFFPLNPTFE